MKERSTSDKNQDLFSKDIEIETKYTWFMQQFLYE